MSVRLLRLLKIVRLLRLLRVLKLLRLLGKYATRFKVSYRTRAILKFMAYIIFTSHWAACLFRIVSNKAYDYVDDDEATEPGEPLEGRRRSLASSRSANPTWLREEGLHADSLWAQYVAAMAWALQALNGGATAYTGAEYCVSVVVMIFGVIVLTLMIGEIANVSTSLDPAGNEYKRTMDMFNSYMDERGFPADLKRELRNYFMHSEGLFREQHYQGMLGNLSPQLREKLAMANVGPWVKSVPVVQYALLQASGLFESARVAVASVDGGEDGGTVYRGAIVGSLSERTSIPVFYSDGSSEESVDVSRLHVPRYLPFGRTFQAAKRAAQSLVCDLALQMTATLYLRDDAIVAMGGHLSSMFLLVDGRAVRRDKAHALTVPRTTQLYGTEHSVIGQDITMRLTTSRQLQRNYEVTARATSHCLCVTAEHFLVTVQRPNLSMLLSPMKRYAGWLMLRDNCVYHPRVVLARAGSERKVQNGLTRSFEKLSLESSLSSRRAVPTTTLGG